MAILQPFQDRRVDHPQPAMSDQFEQRPVEAGHPSTENGQPVVQTFRNDEQVLVPVSGEKERSIQVDGIPKQNPPPKPPLPRTSSMGSRGIPQGERPQPSSNRSFARQSQAYVDSRDVRGPATARGPPNPQRPPLGSYPPDQQYPPPPSTDKSAGGFGNKLTKLGNFMRGEPGHERRHEDDYSRMQRYKKERDEADADYEALEKEMRQKELEFQRALKAEQDKVEAIKLSAHELQKTKDTKELVFGMQKTDDEIRTRFESLLGDIRTWASDFACNTGQEPYFEESMLSEYQRVAPSCAALDQLHAAVKSEKAKQDKKQKRHFIRGWTSYVMIKSLFRTLDEQGNIGHDGWLSNDDSRAFERLENILWHADPKAVSQRSFNDWRALTVQLLSEATKTPSQEERLTVLSQTAAHEVMSLVHVWAHAEKAQDLGARLANIFQEAIHFAQFLRQQRALWTLRLPAMPSRMGPLMFDAGCMKDDVLSDDEDGGGADCAQYRQRYVLLVISPALYKRGTMDGTKFESERAVVPAKVVLATP